MYIYTFFPVAGIWRHPQSQAPGMWSSLPSGLSLVIIITGGIVLVSILLGILKICETYESRRKNINNHWQRTLKAFCQKFVAYARRLRRQRPQRDALDSVELSTQTQESMVDFEIDIPNKETDTCLKVSEITEEGKQHRNDIGETFKE